MNREIVRVYCKQCGKSFRCLDGSVAFREQLCNVCFGLTGMRGADQVKLGWPE